MSKARRQPAAGSGRCSTGTTRERATRPALFCAVPVERGPLRAPVVAANPRVQQRMCGWVENQQREGGTGENRASGAAA
jgi:hypothetical protein